MKLDRKQKVLITLIIIALAFLAWQLYDIFFANNEPTPNAQHATLQSISPATTLNEQPSTILQPIAPSPPTQSTIPPIMPSPQPLPAVALPGVSVSSTPQPVPTLTPTPAKPVTLPAAVVTQPTQPQIRQMTLTMPITATQTEYLRLVNRYQIVRMKRLVVDEEAAIAQSQEKIAQLNQQIAKIGGQTSTTPSGPVSVSITGYQLMYVDNQSGQWSATLSKGGRFIEVTSGMTLADGTRVMRINENGVVILQNGNYYLLNFYGTTRLARFSASPPKRIAPPKPMPQPVIIQSVRKKTLERRIPVKCVANSKDPSCAPKTLAALQPMLITHNTVPQLENPKPISPPQNSQLAQLPALTSSLTAVAATTKTTPQLPTKILPPQASQNSPPQPSPLLQPQPPATLPLKSKQNLLALTPDQKNKVVQIETNIDSYSADEKYLLAAPADHYTLQLIGNNNLSTLTDFSQAHKLNNAYTYHTFYLNKDWFVLIYGIFKTQQEALNAIKTLPLAAQQLKPWVRTLASVQEAIKQVSANR